jgi:threonine dehydratase
MIDDFTTPLAISAQDVRDAAEIIRGVVVRTPLLEYRLLNERIGHRVLIKFEGAQIGGAFKFRGAYNRLARIPETDRGKGVVAWSSGNHAQGVAAAARMLGMPAAIVMPVDAPAIKLANTRALGAEVVLYDRASQSREEIATALAHERGAVLVPSFDDPYIIAGQGTAGLEIVEQAQEAGADVVKVLVCCGGGGLVGGIATAIRDHLPHVSVYSVEPEAFDDTARSLISGRREVVPAGATSICDALLTPAPGELTFPINRKLLAGGLTVSDDEVRQAMRYAFEVLKLVVEPGGAVALAALLSGKAPKSDGATVVVVSGANVDPAMFAEIIAG